MRFEFPLRLFRHLSEIPALFEKERGQVFRFQGAVRVIQEIEGGIRLSAGQGTGGEAREIMGLLLREVDVVWRESDQHPEGGPELRKVASAKNRVDFLDAVDELLTRILRHGPPRTWGFPCPGR